MLGSLLFLGWIPFIGWGWIVKQGLIHSPHLSNHSLPICNLDQIERESCSYRDLSCWKELIVKSGYGFRHEEFDWCKPRVNQKKEKGGKVTTTITTIYGKFDGQIVKLCSGMKGKRLLSTVAHESIHLLQRQYRGQGRLIPDPYFRMLKDKSQDYKEVIERNYKMNKEIELEAHYLDNDPEQVYRLLTQTSQLGFISEPIIEEITKMIQQSRQIVLRDPV